jgi:lipopolysaccharide biosynthesis glycosyltransferase
MTDHDRLRSMVLTVARRLPLGVGRRVSEYAQTRAELASIRAELNGLRSRAELADRLVAGARLEDAVIATVRLHLNARKIAFPMSLAQSLQTNSSTRVTGLLATGLVAHAQRLPDLAWASFRAIPASDWRRLVPEEFLRTAFKVDHARAVDEVRRILQAPPDELSPAGWIGLIRAAFGARELRLAADLFELVDAQARKDPEAWADTRIERDWLRPWIADIVKPPAVAECPPDHTCVAIIDYKQPDLSETSTNIGDWVQTVASLGHLVRHQNLRFEGPADVVSVLETLRGRLRPELRLETAARDVTLVPVHRDATNFCSIPPNTWAITFGWFMQSVFGRHDFPLHPHLRPIFISFHCNRHELLSPAAIEYLRVHGPIGCRDWTTVDLLLSAGVPAFFSGCLTTTVNAMFPAPDASGRAGADAPVAYVDVEPKDGCEATSQADKRVRQETLAANLRRAIDLLDEYRSRHSAVVTSRLHCYLPCRSIGVTVQFTPRNLADIRYNGLVDLSDDAFASIQQGISIKLAAAMSAIVAGKSEEDVYATWREVCASDVAAARARRANVPRIAPPSFDVKAACTAVRTREVTTERRIAARHGAEVDVAMALDGNFKDEMKVVVNAMVEGASRPLHLWVLCRDHGPDDFARFSALFPEVTVTWLPCDDINYGPIRGMLRHITVSTMDRLLLPDLLPEVDRIVYHDIDALALADVSKLYDWDLKGHALAARSSMAGDWASGFGQVLRTAGRLRDDPAAGRDLIHRMFARHPYDFEGFNAGILLLSLARMRADEFGRDFIPFVERYGMNDQEVLNCYAGPNRAPLPPQWNMWPTQDVVSDARIIHWAGPVKPWNREYVAQREVWAEYARRLALRERSGELTAR